MKPVIVCHSTVAGGAEAYLVRLYKALGEKGCKSELVGYIPGWEDTGQKAKDVGLSPKWGLATMAKGLFKLPGERARVARVAPSDASFYHLQFKREQIGLTDILAQQGPVIWTEHGLLPTGVKGMLLGTGYRLAARNVSAIICVSDTVASRVRQVVGPRPRIEVIKTAVDTSVMRPPTSEERFAARASLDIPQEVPVLLWIGRLHPSKLAGLTTWLGSGWPGIVLVAGTGEMLDEIALTAQEQVRNVRVLGHVNDTATLYRAADVMAFTSNGDEGFPTTLVEAAAYGVPVVTNAESGFGDVVAAAGGKVIPPKAKLERWISDAMALTTGSSSTSARQWSLNYDIKAWFEAHENIFRSVI